MLSKRSLSVCSKESPGDGNKRCKLTPSENEASLDDIPMVDAPEVEDDITAVESQVPSRDANARAGIQRSIAMILQHDGFASSTPEAMESFTCLVETYLNSLIEETKRFALASRRDHPIPSDFEAVLRRFNLPVSSLKPHLKNPLPTIALAPSYQYVHEADEEAYATLPLLGPELSGQADKVAKKYIPSYFPEFPSRHTYKFTPQEDINTRDSKKIREEAARTAQYGEDALRRLVRASKMRKQKEAKSMVERDSHGKERFRLWETTMRRFMGAEQRGENTEQVEIADHSMIVNGDAIFARKEVTRVGKRSATLASSSSK
ncbi:hypothetical protein E4U22_001656 [Claviceps purpurea]|uniref:Transcription initiation factor TFIID subunit 8 n=1 Tax=Claviceps purpurea (strain 20.1) TaxID=1111077 RepID=M1WGF4_CLAP2|nr:hypothetical protein E4U51_006740 [Claviceps purpurea]KAG6254770.1 hypothetical protein E4U23_005621 [Claviceps purpurea]KAG6276769.1 hypothetical protein E4U48_001477 [Claviceps purpurea]KAG6324491.1 hypothetical protein E4U22_001656 [Claviceps purpurea]CCE31754.1 uncharacterized protein CPUR_05609 [Claviceps purpurea 20.1]